jgi:hypothetical protein
MQELRRLEKEEAAVSSEFSADFELHKAKPLPSSPSLQKAEFVCDKYERRRFVVKCSDAEATAALWNATLAVRSTSAPVQHLLVRDPQSRPHSLAWDHGVIWLRCVVTGTLWCRVTFRACSRQSQLGLTWMMRAQRTRSAETCYAKPINATHRMHWRRLRAQQHRRRRRCLSRRHTA